MHVHVQLHVHQHERMRLHGHVRLHVQLQLLLLVVRRSAPVEQASWARSFVRCGPLPFKTDRYNIASGTQAPPINLGVAMGALSYDTTRHGLWLTVYNTQIEFLQLDASGNAAGAPVFKFNGASWPGSNVVDGLAYDWTNDTIYYHPDISTTIYHYALNGTLLETFGLADNGGGCEGSGLSVDGSYLWEDNACQRLYEVPKNAPTTVVTNFTTNFTAGQDEGIACDAVTFANQGEVVMWANEYTTRDINAYLIPSTAHCPLAAPPSDHARCDAEALVVQETDPIEGTVTQEYGASHAYASGFGNGTAPIPRSAHSPIPNASASSTASVQNFSIGNAQAPLQVSASVLSSECDALTMNDSTAGHFLDAYGAASADSLTMLIQPPGVAPLSFNVSTLGLSIEERVAGYAGQTWTTGCSTAAVTTNAKALVACTNESVPIESVSLAVDQVSPFPDGYDAAKLHVSLVLSNGVTLDVWVGHVRIEIPEATAPNTVPAPCDAPQFNTGVLCVQ